MQVMVRAAFFLWLTAVNLVALSSTAAPASACSGSSGLGQPVVMRRSPAAHPFRPACCLAADKSYIMMHS